jgi:hypothetical protein
MANDLTGEFDVVAEFAIPAANRVLAAMHSSGRFLHSISARVDDNPPPGFMGDRPTMVGSVDAFGDATVDHSHIGSPNAFPGVSAATDATYSALGMLLNPDLAGIREVPPVPSHIQGRAQLQLFPPAIEVPDASGTNLTVRMNIMSRFFPDPQTAPLAEFVRGNLQITAAVNQVVSPDPNVPNVVDIDFKAEQALISFTPSFSSQPLSAEDLAGINLCIRNALKTSFLPSTAPLPSRVKFVKFKTLFSGQHAISLLLNIQGVPLREQGLHTGCVPAGNTPVRSGRSQRPHLG